MFDRAPSLDRVAAGTVHQAPRLTAMRRYAAKAHSRGAFAVPCIRPRSGASCARPNMDCRADNQVPTDASKDQSDVEVVQVNTPAGRIAAPAKDHDSDPKNFLDPRISRIR